MTATRTAGNRAGARPTWERALHVSAAGAGGAAALTDATVPWGVPPHASAPGDDRVPAPAAPAQAAPTPAVTASAVPVSAGPSFAVTALEAPASAAPVRAGLTSAASALAATGSLVVPAPLVPPAVPTTPLADAVGETGNDSPTAPMARVRSKVIPAPVSPVGASAGGIVSRPPGGPWPLVHTRPARTGPTGASIGSVVALLVGLSVVLALLTVRGAFGAGWTGGLGLAGSVLAVAALCLLSIRARPMLRRFRGRDELTGLVARRAFLDAATRVVGGGEHRVREAAPAALVLVDLDRFREINGVLGHECGDRLLVVAARRLRGLLRPSDLLARIGGDEFAVLLRDAGPGRAELLAGRLRDALRVPVLLADMPVQIEVSVGIAYAPAHGRGAAELLRHAEAAMYEAKQTRAGQRTYQRNRHAPTAPGRARLRLRAELRDALEQDQIELRYQPKADPRTGRVTGAEALVRWQHPREGLRGPAVFLREMEHAGLMPRLTRRVLDLALADCASWHAAGAVLSVSVNVPPSVIDEAGFAGVVGEALRRHGLEPSALVVEVTEEALITVREQARRTLAELRALGVRVSLDDYGTGFCSLAYLRELPADEVKLDQMFLRDMHRDPSAAEIVRSTVALAHALDLKIVAEGVETKAAWLALAGWRCDEVQGYFVSPPLAGGRMVAWLSDWARRVARQRPAQPSQRPLDKAAVDKAAAATPSP
ncbi:putative bifunctional diguanylate cyclase/phosphodiesterase [Frankia nepalensis]|uniref:putative bifunctional diguanylate cyclase/phosphodiesterase n=1 Tax=Frankia nepalensis TaxID=1836974 RepID=UPI0027DD1087|nr:bifunctional diguanylate cyclase/phosphodiesterase [Frankia nepalensis]